MKRIIKSIVLTLILLLILTGTIYKFRNAIADYLLERQLSKINGAEVNITETIIDIDNSSITLKDIQITDPENTYKNRLQINEASVSIHLRKLLLGKIIVEHISASGLSFGSDRQVKGTLQKIREGTEDESETFGNFKTKMVSKSENIPTLILEKIDNEIDEKAFLSKLDLKTPERVKEVRREIEKVYNFWKNRLENSIYSKKISELDTQLDKLTSVEIKSPSDVQNSVNIAQSLLLSSENIHKSISNDKKQLSMDIDSFAQLRKDIDDILNRDLDIVSKELNMILPDIHLENISSILFGKNISKAILIIVDKIKMFRDKSSSLNSDKVEPEDKKHELPVFWIKEMVINNMKYKSLDFSGSISNLTSHQNRIKLPFSFKISGSTENNFKTYIDGLFDYQGEIPTEQLDIHISEIPMQNFKLPKLSFLPSNFATGKGQLQSSFFIYDDKITSNSVLIASNVKLEQLEPSSDKSGRIGLITQKLSESINIIRINNTLKYKDGSLSFKINSNLDKLISDQINTIFSHEIEKSKSKINGQIQSALYKAVDSLDDLIDSRKSQLSDLISSILDSSDSQSNNIDDVINGFQDKLQSKEKKYKKKLKRKIKKLFGGAENLLDKPLELKESD